MSARDRILHNLQKNAPTAAPRVAPLVGAQDSGNATAATRLKRLRTALEAAHAEVHVLSVDQVGPTVLDWCTRRQLRTLMLPAGALPFGLSEHAEHLDIRRFDRPFEVLKDNLFKDIDAGLTIADCAIAETGTLVMSSSPTQPRTLSLVPPIHLCLLDLNRLHDTLSTALQAERWAQAMPSNLIFVSGPSKTADIQQTLAYGAHGPKELIVFLIEGVPQ